MNVLEPNDLCVSRSQSHAGGVRVWCEPEPCLPCSQGTAPPGTALAATPLSTTTSTVAAPASYSTKSEPRGLSVFKQEKQKVCSRELTDSGVY